jgi:hypothetical protein
MSGSKFRNIYKIKRSLLFLVVDLSNVNYLKSAESKSFEEKLLSELTRTGFKKGMLVAVKLHMGEGKGMFSPDIAKRSVAVLKSLGCKPFLFDTVVLYPGPRHFKKGYQATAALHGFTEAKMGCPVVISDDYLIVKTRQMDVEVSKEMSAADAMLVLTHVKGHDCSAFGGALKNLGMGCASPKSKRDQHKLGSPTVNEKCTACGICKKVCPFGAIKITDKSHVNFDKCFGCSTCVYNCPFKAFDYKTTFEELLCEAAGAALKQFEKKPVYYVNDVRNITKHCDCFPFPGSPVAKDVGIILGADVVAVDRASLDLAIKQEGKDFFKELHHHDPYFSVVEAEKQKLGSQKYKLIEV